MQTHQWEPRALHAWSIGDVQLLELSFGQHALRVVVERCRAEDPNKTDRTKATTGTGGRVSLGAVSLSGGKGRATYQMAPAAPWSYGPNWVCAATPTDGQTGVVGDQIFTIYPV